MRISLSALAVVLLAAALMSTPAAAQSLGGGCNSYPRSAAAAYCASHGGCPKDGYCYFPDGTYCDLQAFYNGTCPGKEYYEQMMWEAEAYQFLYTDYPYGYMPSPYGYYPFGYYPYGYYYNSWPGYWPYTGNPLPLSPASAHGSSLA